MFIDTQHAISRLNERIKVKAITIQNKKRNTSDKEVVPSDKERETRNKEHEHPNIKVCKLDISARLRDKRQLLLV